MDLPVTASTSGIAVPAFLASSSSCRARQSLFYRSLALALAHLGLSKVLLGHLARTCGRHGESLAGGEQFAEG